MTQLKILAGTLVLALAASSPRAAATRPITETDLFKFTWVADPQISPDGTTVAFVKVVVNEKENRYDTAIWSVPSAGSAAPRPLTGGFRDTSPRWSPDGKWLAFVRTTDKDGQAQPAQLYLLRTDGGEARALTDIPKGASAPVWAPDGKSIAFSSTTVQDDLKKPHGAAAKSEHKSDVKVVSRAVYRSNGNPGYIDADRHAHIWTVPVSDPGEHAAARQLTSGDFDERGFQWSPDSATIYFTSDRRPESYFEPSDSDLYSVPAIGGSHSRRSRRSKARSAAFRSPPWESASRSSARCTARRSAPTASRISGSSTRCPAARRRT